MTLLFYVNNQSLSLSPAQQDKRIVADSKNYLKAQFILQTIDWNNYQPWFALFTQDGKTYKKYLGVEKGVKPNECYVPQEVIKAGTFTVALCGGNLMTSDTVACAVAPSGYTEDIENEEITPEAAEQLNALFYQYASACNDILKECRRIKAEIMEVANGH